MGDDMDTHGTITRKPIAAVTRLGLRLVLPRNTHADIEVLVSYLRACGVIVLDRPDLGDIRR